jgi:dihydrofolate reductase
MAARKERHRMGKVSAGATMSLDGFIAGPNDTGFDLLFKWYGAGDVEVPMPDSTAEVPTPRVSKESAGLLRQEMASWGALVCGRHLYDLTNAWNGRHPLNVTTVVLTHHPPEDRPLADENFVFVTDGIEAAIATAQEIAGDRGVAVNGGQMAKQALDAGLLDEIGVDLVPVLLGEGTRLFDLPGSGLAPREFEGPFRVVLGIGVTHLRYRVIK